MTSLKNAIILHGTMGSPDGNWFKWLKSQLEQQGMNVWLPTLPNAEQPSLKQWLSFVRGTCPFPIDQQTLIVGHSSGAILALIIAQTNQTQIGKIMAVSVFCDNSLGWEPNAKLFDVPFEWEEIQPNASDLQFVHSDNDPYAPLEQAQFVAKNCGGALTVMPDQGHFNLEKGPEYAEFPELLKLLIN